MMYNIRLNLRNVVAAVAICLAGSATKFAQTMKRLKIFVVGLLLAAATLFTGCGSESDEPNKEITASNPQELTQIVYADETEGESSVTFVTSGAWTSETSATWVSIEPKSGEQAGSQTVNISLEPNGTGSERKATIKIMCNGENITVNVTQKETKRDGTPYEPDNDLAGVYVAGRTPNHAVLWKDGIIQNISDGTTTAYANSVFVSGGNVYVAGYETNAEYKTVAILWINSVAQDLNPTDETKDAYANSVFVSGSNVYVAGYERSSVSAAAATLWKNGVVQNLGSGFANSVYVSGSDVYVAGFTWGDVRNSRAILWKNGEEQDLGVGHARSVFVSGDDVYVAGTTSDAQNNMVATLWKNGEAEHLAERGSRGRSVYVSGNDVYVAGYEEQGSPNIALLWKNGDRQIVATTNYWVQAESVFVSGDDVYVVGYNSRNDFNRPAFLWINGEEQEGLDFQSASSVFVVEKK